MYKFLLSWRYLRSRYIALASVVSVTLGVATLIVVNSVMAGFTREMKGRLKGILSDIEVASPGLGEVYNPDERMAQIRETIGDDLEGISAVARTPAMIHIDYHGRMLTQQIMLYGIDDATYSSVSDFGPYLKNMHNREQITFDLREDGYDEGLPMSGWPYRRQRAEYERELNRHLDSFQQAESASADQDSSHQESRERVILKPLPTRPPELVFDDSESEPDSNSSGNLTPPALQPRLQRPERFETDIAGPSDSSVMPKPDADPFQSGDTDMSVEPFDEATDQYTGIIIGMALASRKMRDPDTNEVSDIYLARPGDNVQITLPTVGSPPRPVYEVCTVVDLYESKMHEYDSSFAFMPLSEMQRIRRMIGPQNGRTVSAIQIRLKPHADLKEVKRKLQKLFPPTAYPYDIHTWQDTQKPLLAAVEMEITVLNILLFLIIAVAGFGILATFFMIVVEKTRDIGILKALGAPGRGVMSIFLGYGLSLGIVGSGVGIGIGLLFVVYINDIARLIERMTGREVFDPTIYYFSEIPTIIDPLTVGWVAVGAVLIAVMASILPALRAARLHPVEALRYE